LEKYFYFAPKKEIHGISGTHSFALLIGQFF